MKKYFSVLIWCFLFFLVPTLGVFSSLHTQARAEWVGLNFGIDNDQAKLNNTMSNAPYLNHTGLSQYLVTACAIYPFFGPNNCTNDKNIQASLLNKSALGNIAMAMSSMYDNPPADLALWVRDTGQTLGFIPKQAYAQGVGFSGLAPLLPIWKAFRNIAYVLLALAMVVVGFMVMMRKQIDPKTVVTVQNALPRIVIALILITFSYAIVGLMVDIMYLVIAFITIIVRANLPNTSEGAELLRVNYASGGFFDLFYSIFGALWHSYPSGQIFGDMASGQWGEAFNDFVTGGLLTITGVGPLFLFLIGLAYLFAFVRILLMLLGAYTQILLAVLTGPIQILGDVFPGVGAFTSWVKNLFANLIVFPITIFFLMLANAIVWNFGDGKLWVPPLLPQAGVTGGLAKALIAIGIIMTIPSVVNGIKEALKAKSPMEAGPGVIFGPLGRAGATAFQGAYQLSMIASGVQSVFGKFGGGDGGHGGKK